MIHFDWDILGVNLETFSPEMTPLQPYLSETIVKPKQVELFTSLLRQEATTVETPSLRPTMFPQSIIMPEKPQNVRQMSANVAANAPATEDTTPSVKVPSTQIPTTQKSIAQMPVDQKPVISQTASVQEPASTPYITVKASISAPLQPTVSLENLEALESLEVLDHLAPLEIAQRPVMAAANAPSTENTRSSVEASSTQMPTTQKSFTQRPVAQMPILAQTTSAQEPASTPYTTVKASVSTLLQPTAPLESLDFLEPQVHLEPLKNLEPLETAAIAPTTENTTPSTEAPSTQMPVAQKSVSAQAASAQKPTSTLYITVKAPVSTPLQPMASLEKLEALESLQVLDHLEPLETAQKPTMAVANAPAMGNAKPSVETSYTQMPMVQKSVTMQTAFAQKPVIVAANAPAMENVKPSVEVPSMQMPTAQMPSMQEPVAQKPIIAQTASAQAPINTPYITAKAPVSTLLQPMAQESLVFLEPLVYLEPLKNLEPLEKAAMATAMENAKPSVEVPYTQIHTVQVPKPQQPVIAQMPSMQIPVAQKPIIAQTASTQDPVSTSYITVKASVTAPLQSMASLENLEALEVLDHLEPLETAAMVPTMENTKPSVQEPSTHVPTVQKPIIAQTLSAQESASTRYITVKAPASTLLQPAASLESLEVLDHLEPLEIAQKPVMAVAANAPATENTKSSVEIPFVQMPTAQKPIIARTPSTQMPVTQMPAIAQMPSAQLPSMQAPIIAQTASAQMPVNTPYITVKASTAVPSQPTAPLESLVFLEPLVHLEPLKNLAPLETAAMVPTMENAKSSVQEPSVQIPMPQKPFVQILTAQAPFAELPLAQMPAVQKHVIAQTAFTQIPMAQKTITAQTLSAQKLANTPYITVKASVSTLLQPTAPLASLVFLEPLVHLEPLKDLEPLETAAMAPAMENAKQPFVEMHSTQMPVAQMPAMQKPIIAQTASAQVPANTPYITVKTSVSTLLQPTALLESLDFLEPLVHLEPLETAAMAPAMENAKPSVQEPSMQMPMPQKHVIAQTAFTQMPMAQMPVNTPYITIKASVSTLQQPTAPLEPLVHLEPLKNLEPLEIAVKAPAMENAKPSVQEASVLMPMPQKPSVQMSTAQKPVIAQKPIIVQTQSAQESASASYITGKVSVSAPQQPMASLENLVLLKPLESLETSAMGNAKPSAQLPMAQTPVAQTPVAQTPSTQVPVAHKSVTVQTSSAHVSANTPYITIKASHSFTQKLEAPQKPHQKTSSMPDVVAPSIQAAATAISQPINLAMPSVAPVKASSIAMSPAQILSETVNELTAAIMVNIDENGHLGEIRLVLKPDVLDGTTILLKCDQKQVSVTFFPGAESAEQLLVANQNHIAETLAATGHLPVKISIINSEGRRQIRKPA